MIPRAAAKILVFHFACQSVLTILQHQIHETSQSKEKENVFPYQLTCNSLENKLKYTLNCFQNFGNDKYMFYEIKTRAYGILYISLKASSSFFANSFQEDYLYDGLYQIRTDDKENQSCIYEGHVLNESSKVILNICGGLQGLISKSNVDLFISPIKNSGIGEHILYATNNFIRSADQQEDTNNSFKCGLSEGLQRPKIYHNYQLFSSKTLGALVVPKKQRVRRAYSQKRFIETMIVADQSMFDFYGQNEIELRNYLLSVMAIVSSIMKDSSIGNFIHVSLVRLLIIKKNPPELDITAEARDSLRKFCKWQKSLNKWSDDDPEYFDTAILITRTNLCTNAKCDTLGLAELGSMCDPGRSCSIVEDNGLSAAFTVAHELGHLLNSPHDGVNNICTEEFEKVHIMTPSFSLRSKTWTWSACSRKYITSYLESSESFCLSDKPSKLELNLPVKLPGEIYSMADQCKLVYGENSTACRAQVECDRIWCIDSNNLSKPCYTNNMPWADGTKCGAKMWCSRGKCKPKYKYEPVHGEWGEWSDFGECSRTCGGGIKVAVRDCDNPKPAYNGYYCVGLRQKYESCSTESCPKNSKSFRAVQCSAYDGKNLDYPGVPKGVQWIPKYVSEEECKLFCEIKGSGIFYELASKVIDGTSCKKETNGVCIDGKCRVSGCDNVLNSHARVDNCGICNGDNSSCKTFYGYKNTSSYGYNFVVRVPQGASNLNVVQVSDKEGMFDTHFLVLLNQQRKYIINGEWTLPLGNRCHDVAGNSVCYSGPESPNETITVNGTLKSEMEIQVLSAGESRTCNIYYSYNYLVHEEKQKFKWMLKSFWTDCFPICKGYQSREYECQRIIDSQVVADSSCKDARPRGKIRTCNDDCYLQWSVVISECVPFSECGLGKQEQKVICEKVYHANEQKKEIVHHKDCRKAKVGEMPPAKKICFTLCTNVRWIYSQWSECNSTCDGGLQWRTTQCVDISSNAPLPSVKCNYTLPGPLTQSCNVQPCPENSIKASELEYSESIKSLSIRKCFDNPCQLNAKITQNSLGVTNELNQVKWITSSWKECSQSCGGGIQTRTVYCSSLNGIVDEIECKFLNKPMETRTCNNLACPFWRIGRWSKCSKTCGNGFQTRLVLCGFNGTIVSNEYCDQQSKQQESQICNIPKCDQPLQTFNLSDHLIVSEWIISEWSQCSVSCGSGISVRNLTCSSASCNNSEMPSVMKTCHIGSCPKWNYSEWTSCYYPQNCGLGWQVRQIQCKMANGVILNMTACDQTQKPESNRSCEMKRCKEDVKWVTTQWEPCNVLCGDGNQYRHVSCEDLQGNLLNEKDCLEFSSKPNDQQPCIQTLCPKWYSYEWGACDTSCVHQRVVECRQNDQVVDASLCNLDEKPNEEMECVTENCVKEPDYKWRVGEWTPCDQSCGYSFRSRDVSCIDKTFKKVNNLYCSQNEKPKSLEYCFEGPCPPSWQIGPWQECSVSCGGGFQLRDITCQGEAGSLLPDSECELDQKISVRRACNLGKCGNMFRWLAGPWSECSLSCGVGETYRKVECVNSANKTEPTYNCEAELMPPNFKVCNIQRCPLRTCRDVQREFNVYFDGEHTLLIKNKTSQIYCEGMHRNNPKEYISLMADPKENYAEIYNKRLQQEDLCPDNGRRQISCVDCIDYNASGVTFFKKLRFDIRKMIIIPEDKTFAEQFGQNPPSYATAGDCYSKSNCTQGSFMINLQNTGFRLADDVEWVTHGYHASQQIQKQKHNQVIVGKCGGYCGMCSPNSKLGLKLEFTVP